MKAILAAILIAPCAATTFTPCPRGGKQFNLLDDSSSGCSSSYGLCDAETEVAA